jgi:hypothetical protein
MISQGSYGFREEITVEGDPQYVDTITNIQLVLVGPNEESRLVKNLTASQDRDPITKVWSWEVQPGDLLLSGLHSYQVIDTSPGRNVASGVGRLFIGPRI